MKFTLGRLALGVVGLAIVGAVVVSLRPSPVPVDVALVVKGPLAITVDEDGETRVRDRYTVSAPLSGQLRRIQLKAGAKVEADETILAIIEPTDPALLDRRQRAIDEARVKAAEAAVEQAETQLREALADLDLARTEFARIQNLAKSDAATERQVDEASNAYRKTTEQYASAQFGAQIARYELEQARAALIHAQSKEPSPQTVRYEVDSPITGRVLRVLQESAGVVQPGTELLELGDLSDLEVVVDVLSTDAVKIRPGARVIIDQWGGDDPLKGHVDYVEPSGFTKVSALGVEEQRVNVVIRIDTPQQQRPTLADAFRVEARIVIWESDSVVKVPTSCLFREDDHWAVYLIEDERAVLRHIEIGHRGRLEAEVLEGLNPGMKVIEHPADQIKNGTLVTPRQPEEA